MEEHKISQERKRGMKRFLPRTLFVRSLLILILPIFLIQVISTFIFFDRHWTTMTTRLAFAVAGEIALISSYIEQNDGNDTDKIINLAEHQLGILVTYDKGKTLPETSQNEPAYITSWESMVERTLTHELKGVVSYPFMVNVDFQEKWVEVRVQLTGGILNISLPQRRLFSSTTYIFLLWMFGVSILLLIISVLFMRGQIRPIRRLAIAAERFGKGRDVKNFKIEGAREVRQAGQAFLDMKTRIQRQISQRTEMLAGVSHDLRTPLTRLKLQVAMMGDGPDIYAMKKDIADMEKMIEGYLNFVRGEGRENTTITDIPAMLEDITVAAKRQGHTINLNLNDVSVHIPLRPGAFKRCLNNIIGNAVKHADNIWITLERKDKEIQIVIEDDGPGIEDNKIEDVFRPFYRVDNARDVSAGSVGLGLPIAMDIVHAHGGEIWLDKSTHGGLAVYISLPV